MKYAVGGCLLVAAAVAIAFGAAGYMAYRAAGSVMSDATDAKAGVDLVASEGERIANRARFDPPESGELTPLQVDRFLAVQARVRAALDTQWSVVTSRSDSLRAALASNPEGVSAADVAGLLADMMETYVRARRAQVDALNVQKFSASEYAWVRLRVYESAGLQLAGTLDLSALTTRMGSGGAGAGLTIPPLPRPDVPKANLNLVSPHAAKLKAWLPMAILGL